MMAKSSFSSNARYLLALLCVWWSVKYFDNCNISSSLFFILFFVFYYNVLLCYALLTSVRIPLSELPTVRPKCFTDRSPMCCANHDEEER